MCRTLPFAVVMVSLSYFLPLVALALDDCTELDSAEPLSGTKVYEDCKITDRHRTIGSNIELTLRRIHWTGGSITLGGSDVKVMAEDSTFTEMDGDVVCAHDLVVNGVWLHGRNVMISGHEGSVFSVRSDDAQNVSIALFDSVIEVQASHSASSCGAVSILPLGSRNIDFSVSQVSLSVLKSSLIMTGVHVACVGVLKWSDAAAVAKLTDLTLTAVDSKIQALASMMLSCVGVAVRGRYATFFSSQRVTMTFSRTLSIVSGFHYVAHLGVASGSPSGCSCSVNEIAIHCQRSTLLTEGGGTVTTGGIATYSTDGNSTILLVEAQITLIYSHITTNTTSDTASSVGVVSYGCTGSSVTVTNFALAARSSQVMTIGWDNIASLGALSYCFFPGCSSVLKGANIRLITVEARVSAHGQSSITSSYGFGSFAEHSTSITATTIANATLITCGSTIFASEVAFDVVARLQACGWPERFQDQRPVSVANWSVTILDSTVTTEYDGWTGNCLMALPNATHNGTAPSIIRDSVLSCSGLPTTELMAPYMLFTSNVTNRTGNEVAFIGANTTSRGPRPDFCSHIFPPY